ncbi:GNAT family N-acetyltransferase [Guptibacillus algicola]|uniref:GNAT family N-acetyltransferase n=1 Tax=Guptibacillus algicola TaxID=225844 RepID=UPI001CD7008A|nr:GNAT family N-acetyltransferase [Alkalihalobacillus algicola]MCA0987348.1 GNAT family N-acetyltransferase [Alkalihalobacillus algicola]
MLRLQKVKASEEKLLHNVMQYYFYEFSKYIPEIRLEQNGAYKPFELEKYWSDSNFHAYFIKVEDELIGFALVESAHESSPNTIQEFFIMAKHSGKGYGKQIATRLFTMFPGDWEITQIEKNKPAQLFWRSLINEITNGEFTERVEGGKYLQLFNTEAFDEQ